MNEYTATARQPVDANQVSILGEFLTKHIKAYKENPHYSPLLFPSMSKPTTLYFTERAFIKLVDPQFTTELSAVFFRPVSLVTLYTSLHVMNWQFTTIPQPEYNPALYGWYKDCTRELNQ